MNKVVELSLVPGYTEEPALSRHRIFVVSPRQAERIEFALSGATIEPFLQINCINGKQYTVRTIAILGVSVRDDTEPTASFIKTAEEDLRAITVEQGKVIGDLLLEVARLQRDLRVFQTIGTSTVWQRMPHRKHEDKRRSSIQASKNMPHVGEVPK